MQHLWEGPGRACVLCGSWPLLGLRGSRLAALGREARGVLEDTCRASRSHHSCNLPSTQTC